MMEPIASGNATSDHRKAEFMRKLTKSLDEVQVVYKHALDARKVSELPARPDDIIVSAEYQKSLESGAPIGVAVEPMKPVAPRRKMTLEEQIVKAPQEEHAKDPLQTFPKSEGLTTEQAKQLLETHGRNELPEKVTPKWLIFCSQLWQPMPVMIWIAAVVEIAIGNYIDGGILIVINLINATLSFYETTKAGDAVAALKSAMKPTAVVMRDGRWDNDFDSRYLVPGDLIELAAGKSVPADCMINHGQVEVDESAMTGESLPVTLREREMAKMGGTVARGETHATVVLTGKNTFFGKTASMLQSTESHSNLQKLLMKIIIILCVMAFSLCGSAFVYLLLTKQGIKKSLSFAVVVIVASIPMAVEIVTTTTLAIGSRKMSSFGAIVSRLAAIEDLAGLNMLCSDKTGTLTKNKMMIQDEAPVYVPNTARFDLLKQAALATRWDTPPKDALDTMFLRCPLWWPEHQQVMQAWDAQHPHALPAAREDYFNTEVAQKLMDAMKDYESIAFMPFDPRVKRTEGTIRVKSSGVIFKVTKGAPHILQHLDKDHEKGVRMQQKVTQLGEDGVRAVAIAISDPIHNWVMGGDNNNIEVTWHITGMLTFLDPPRDDTKDTIEKAQRYGVPIRMITGDHLLIARKTCRDLDMGDKKNANWPNIQGPDHLPMLDEKGKPPAGLVRNYGKHIKAADGFAQVFPEHKFLIVETFRQLGYKCGMTGDGVNDAPALKRADVGIAVAGATDAARAAADIVLTREGLGTIVLGMEVARIIFARMKSFLTYRIAATMQLLVFFFIAVFSFHPQDYVTIQTPHPGQWPSFFSLPVIFLMIITIINDVSLISIGYDNAEASRYPERWVVPVLFIVASTLGAIACLSSLLLLHFCLQSWEPSSLLQKMHIGGLGYGQIVNVIFLKVAVSDILTLYSARAADQFFFQRKPHWVLLVCSAFALTVTTLLSLLWPCGVLDEVHVCGLSYAKGQYIALWVWLYCIVVFFVQDALKVAVWKIIIKFNLFNNNNQVGDVKLKDDSYYPLLDQ